MKCGSGIIPIIYYGRGDIDAVRVNRSSLEGSRGRVATLIARATDEHEAELARITGSATP